MTRQISNAHSASEPARTMNVVAPKDGIPNTINTTPGSYLNLDFDPTGAEYSRQGTDLVFTFPDGNAVMLADFFAVDSVPLPTFILPDGSHVVAADLFTGIDTASALGSLAVEQKGSGVGDYNDNSGELIGGVDRLPGDANPTYWERGPDPPEVVQQSATLQNDSGDSVEPPVTPPVVLPIKPPVMPFSPPHAPTASPVTESDSGITSEFATLDADIVGSSITNGNGPDFSALIDSGINCSDVLDLLYDYADVLDIAFPSDNVFQTKGDSDCHVDFSDSGWNATGHTVIADNTAYDVYSNDPDAYILMGVVHNFM